jgi:hypothetical protein
MGKQAGAAIQSCHLANDHPDLCRDDLLFPKNGDWPCSVESYPPSIEFLDAFALFTEAIHLEGLRHSWNHSSRYRVRQY